MTAAVCSQQSPIGMPLEGGMSLESPDSGLIDDLILHLGAEAIATDPEVLLSHSHDFGKIVDPRLPLAIVFPERVEDLQAARRLAAAAATR